MTTIITVLTVVQIAVLVLTISLAIIYVIPILLIRRFHNTNNVYTVNLCFATIVCCSYWLFLYVALEFYPAVLSGSGVCVALNYFQMMCTLQVPLAVVEASVHRLCLVVHYTKPFFKTRQWAIICIVIHWTIGFTFALPRISFNDPVRSFSLY